MDKMLILLVFLTLSQISTAQSELFDKKLWKSLKYGDIAPNKVSFNESSMTLEVNQSAGPALHRFSKPRRLKSFDISGQFIGKLNLPKKIQGSEGADDFLLRWGLIFKGTNTLNFWERLIAPDWLVDLFRLAPKGFGVEKIELYSVASDKRILGKKRVHPRSEVLTESFPLLSSGDAPFQLKQKLPDGGPLVIGLWLGADGDDTKSSFNVRIDSLNID